MTEEFRGFHAFRPDGEPAASRWSDALQLFAAPEAADAASRWERAGVLFEARDYAGAAKLLTAVVEEYPEQVAPRLLLARAYYHSAQLRRAEAELRAVLDRDPVEHYAHLMLGRTLQRQGRDEEAAGPLRTAAALAA
ncbi:tetratricopeptide repeat protein [Streptomyces synnematoformans]|uniref:Tetratricopeptide repeat protein n=1 Tax=Streptomyces synnematoformans TaxID=415721 RepID=A0ABN2AES1_9ACTN